MMRLGTAPTIALLTLAGAGLGAHFGRATVESINPFYSTEARGTQSYAALTPQGARGASGYNAPASLSAADEGWGTGCVGCARPGTDGQTWFDAADVLPPPAAVIEQAAAEEYPDYEVETDAAALADERRLVQLYAHYPVNQEELEAHDAAVAATLAREAAFAGEGAFAVDGAAQAAETKLRE